MSCHDDILEEFIGLYESGAIQDVDSFVARYPIADRASIEQRCRDYLRTRAELSAGPTPSQLPLTIGRYEIVRLLGVGGMATVYEGRDEQGTRVAIKALHPHVGLSDVQRKRLRLEHVIGSDLRHPHLVEIEEFGEDHACTFLVMRQVMHESLADEIQRFRNRGERIPSSRVVDVGIAIGQALACLHSNDVIHRDVKPHNILLDEDGAPRLSDYGLARLRDDLHSHLTASGQAVGTVSYMSPEQAIANATGIDSRSDIYSLGVVMYEMLALRLPFDSQDSGQLQRLIALSEVPPPSTHRGDIPVDLETICLKALERTPRRRYQTVEALIDDLRRFRDSARIRARRASPLRRGLQRHRRKLTVAGLLSALALTMWIGAEVALAGGDAFSVTVTTDSPGAEVHARFMEPLSGQFRSPELLGTTPLTTSLPVGVVRFIVVAANGDFAELTRRPVKDEELTLTPTLVPSTHAREDMVLITGGMPPPITVGPYRGSERHEVADFLMDRAEVTNGEYLTFLEATGRPRPDWWPNVLPEGWRKLPVCRISMIEAMEYAEWAGKRLPTRREWQLAAAGTEGRTYPWPPPAGDANAKANTNKIPTGSLARDLAKWRDAYANASPVMSHPGDRTAAGVFDLLGNVKEWSDSIALRTGPGTPEPDLIFGCVHGSSFATAAEPVLTILNWHAHSPMGRTDVGFRCAKSIRVP